MIALATSASLITFAIFMVILLGGSYKNLEDAITDFTGLDIEQIELHKVTETGDFLFAFYQTNDLSDIRVLCLEKNLWGAFTFAGSSSTDKQVNMYQRGGNELIVIIYGDNKVLNAKKYSFEYKNREYSNDITERYFLDLFKIANQDNKSSLVDACYFYDAQGNELATIY